MNVRLNRIALATAITLASMPGIAGAFDDCPTNVDCTEVLGEGKNGGFFRVLFPADWDGDLVIVNHGFDLNRAHIRPHEQCTDNGLPRKACETDADCDLACNNISFSGVDQVVLPMGKAVAATTYSQTGWAVFGSAKDLKDMIGFVKKNPPEGKELKRVIVTGFSLGGAVTADATLKLKIDGAIPMCGAVGGGLPTWDVAQDVRLVYDFLCDGVTVNDVPAYFNSSPDTGEATTGDYSADSTTMGLTVNRCLGNLFPSGDPEIAAQQAARLADFLALTEFSSSGFDIASAMGFATIGLGDFVRDPERLKSAPIGWNDTLDYSTQGANGPLAAQFEAGVGRMTEGKGRKKLTKVSYPDFTKGKGAKVAYPILSMAGAADWLVIPEFQRVYTTALSDGSKAVTQTWIDTFGHCVFTAEEITALFTTYFAWLGVDEQPNGLQPTAQDVEDACLALPTGVDGDTCNFNSSFTPGGLFDRIPPRADWPAAATH